MGSGTPTRKEKIALFVIALLVGALVRMSESASFFAGIENFFEDVLVSPKPVRSDIVILAIDSESIHRIGQWPWPRAVFAKALTELEKNSPRALGIDIVFSELSRVGAQDDKIFADALAKITYPVILAVEAEPLSLQRDGAASAAHTTEPLPIFETSPHVALGHVNLIVDADGIVRRFPPAIMINKKILLPAFAYAIAAAQTAAQNPPPKTTLRIVYAAPTGSIQRVPFWRIFGDVGALLKNKIVLLGATSPDLHDEKPTPVSRGTPMPGVEIQANIVNMFLEGYRLFPLSLPFAFAWIILAALIPACVFFLFRQSLRPIFINIGIGALHTIAIVILFDHGIAANFIHINLAWILGTGSIAAYRYFSTDRDRLRMRQLFSKYVSKDVLEEILKDPASVKLGGEEREVTVFFSDIRGFTTFSEKTSPAELVGILNRYFTLMTNQILMHGGVVDKYIGDAIMAFWGAPIANPLQADHALEASFGMIRELKKLNAELRAEGEPEINIGIGLYTGPAIVGNIGSEARFDYTVIGDTVNVASRLEGLNKEYKTNIIIGETTAKKLREKYNLKPLGSVAVKGRKEELNIFTPASLE